MVEAENTSDQQKSSREKLGLRSENNLAKYFCCACYNFLPKIEATYSLISDLNGIFQTFAGWGHEKIV